MNPDYSTTSYNLSDDEKNEFINNDFVRLCKNHIYVPSVLPPVHRIIVLGDIHGDYDLAIKLLEIAKVIKVSEGKIIWTGGDTVVVQVGDQIDRCRPKSVDNLSCSDPNATINDEASDINILKLFTELNNQAIKFNGAVISLLGNHELMNVMGYLDYVSYKGIKQFDNYIDPESNIKIKSGLKARKHAFKPGNNIGKFLGCTRVSCIIIGSNLFVHAGMLNFILDQFNISKASDLDGINVLVRKWLLGLINKEYVKEIINSSNYSMFWTRILGSIPPNMSNSHPLCTNYIDKVLKVFKIGSIIIGHTPQSFLYNQAINATCDNNIIRVDNGSSAAFHAFDEKYLKFGIVNNYREPQVLEIINDINYNIIS